MNQKIICLLRTIILCYLVSFLLISLAAFILSKSELSFSQMRPGIYAIYALSCIFGGFLAGRKLKEKRILWGIILGFAYFIVLLLLSLAVMHTIPALSSKTLIILALCLAGGLVGAIIS